MVGIAPISLVVGERVELGSTWSCSGVSGSEAEVAVWCREDLLAACDGNILGLNQYNDGK